MCGTILSNGTPLTPAGRAHHPFILRAAVRRRAHQSLKPTGYVDDFAGVLNAQTKTSLENLATELDHKANAQIAVVTVKSLDGDESTTTP